MIAFIVYVSGISPLLVAAAMAVEPLLRAVRLPTRSAWLAAMFGAAFAALLTLSGPPRPAPAAARRASGTGSRPAGAAQLAPAARQNDAPRAEGAVVPTVLPASTAPAMPDVTRAVAGGWALASSGCFIWLLAGMRRISRLRGSCRTAEVCGETVLLSNDVGPAVLGVLRHRIVIPSWVRELEPDAQRLIIAHEREHVAARDPLVLHAAMLLVALMPWNIAFWFALHRLRAAIEIDCDARVLRARRPLTGDYCRLLLEVGERTVAAASPLLALAEPATLLERRIESMTTTRKLQEWKTLVPAAAAALLLAGACRAPRPEVAPFRSAPSRSSITTSVAAPTSSGAVPLRTVAEQPVSTPASRPVTRTSLPMIVRSPAAVAFAADTTVRDTSIRNEEALRRSAAEYQARIDAIADSVILASYPGLTRRQPGTPAFLALVLDDRGRVMRHAVSLDPALPNDLAAIMLAMHVDTISGRTIGLGISDNNRWKVTVGHAVEALGPVRGHTELRAWMNAPRPYSLRRVPYERIVDSVARARNADAYEQHEGTYLIAMLLDEAGRVTRYAAEPQATASVKSERIPRLMNRLLGDSTPSSGVSGVMTRLVPSKTVILWGLER